MVEFCVPLQTCVVLQDVPHVTKHGPRGVFARYNLPGIFHVDRLCTPSNLLCAARNTLNERYVKPEEALRKHSESRIDPLPPIWLYLLLLLYMAQELELIKRHYLGMKARPTFGLEILSMRPNSLLKGCCHCGVSHVSVMISF